MYITGPWFNILVIVMVISHLGLVPGPFMRCNGYETCSFHILFCFPLYYYPKQDGEVKEIVDF